MTESKTTASVEEFPNIPLTVVTIKGHIRCVYVNDYRIVGGKPWVSEGGEFKNFIFTLANLRSAFPELEIRVKEPRHDAA